MTKAEFTKAWCKRSGIAIDQLEKLGLVPVPCNCDASNCRGWAMVSKENAEIHKDLYGVRDEIPNPGSKS